MAGPLLLALAGAAASSCALSEPPTPEGLILAENRWVAALEMRDQAALDCRLAPGFTDSNWRGELVGRAAVLTALPNRPPSTLVLSELVVEVHSRFGIVHGINTQRADGKIVGRVRFTDVFVRSGGGWRALAAQETVVENPVG
jgi:hypothetical protein